MITKIDERVEGLGFGANGFGAVLIEEDDGRHFGRDRLASTLAKVQRVLAPGLANKRARVVKMGPVLRRPR